MATFNSGFELKLARVSYGHFGLLSEAFAESSDRCLLLADAVVFSFFLLAGPSFEVGLAIAVFFVGAVDSFSVVGELDYWRHAETLLLPVPAGGNGHTSH